MSRKSFAVCWFTQSIRNDRSRNSARLTPWVEPIVGVVFTLSSDKVEKQQEKKSQENNEFKEAIWLDIYKENENEFKEAFRGFMKKDSFRDKILEEFKNNEETLLTIQDLKEKSQTIFGRTPTILPLLSIIEFKKLLEIESDKIWNKKIIGKADVPIAGLIQKLNLILQVPLLLIQELLEQLMLIGLYVTVC